MQIVRNITTCSTIGVRGLDQQLIAQMNTIAPDSLVSIADLNIQATGSAVWLFLQPAARSALEEAIDDRGTTLRVNSGYRTIAQQLVLYQHFRAGGRCGIPLAARPGRSNHQSGLALDIQDDAGWRSFLQQNGWRWLGPRDRFHFDFIGRNTRDIRGIAVQAFQKLWNQNNPNDLIDEDGIYGPTTANRLGRSPVEGFPKGERVAIDMKQQDTNNFPRLLFLRRPPVEGDDVRKVQEALIKKGFSLKVDGFFGPNTEKAVKDFQAQEGLAADGIVGIGTLAELEF